MDEKVKQAFEKALAYIAKKKNAVGKKLNKDQSLFEMCGEYKSSDTQWENWLDEAEILNFVEALLKQAKKFVEDVGLWFDVVRKAVEHGIWIENELGEMVAFKCFLVRHPKQWYFKIAFDTHVPLEDHKKKWWLYEELSDEQKARISHICNGTSVNGIEEK